MEQESTRIFHRLIVEICNELNIEYTFLSCNWIIRLERDNIIRFIVGNRWDLNSEAAGNIMCDKYATFEILHNAGVSVVEHKMVFNNLIRV